MSLIDLWILFGVISGTVDAPKSRTHLEGWQAWTGYYLAWIAAWPFFIVALISEAAFGIAERRRLLRRLDKTANRHENSGLLKAALREMSMDELRAMAQADDS